jgi:hypothetical protein
MKIKKLAILAWLAVILATAGCRQGEIYDIRGDWSFRRGDEEQFAFRFEGSRESGTLKAIGMDPGQGTYAVTGTEIAFHFTSSLPGGLGCNFLGAFESEEIIKGNLEIVAPYPPFSWTFDVAGFRL